MESSERKKRYYLLKILLLILILIILDRSTGMIMKHFYFRQEAGVGYLTTYSLDSTTADILVFGSSRANHNYVPEIFEENFHCTFYNAGRDGTYILHNYALFKVITSRYSPELILFDLRPEDLQYTAKEYEMLALLSPYYYKPEIKKILDMRGPFEKLKMASSSYPYNSLIFQIAMGNLRSDRHQASVSKGYVPISRKMDAGIIDTSIMSVCNADINKLKALKDIILTCREKKIGLVFVNSPTWRIMKENSQCVSEWNTFQQNNVIQYYNMSNLPVFISNPQYFSDRDHLNDEGARLFSTMLAKSLIQTNKFSPTFSFK